ncbi:hypothetical protein AN221_13235 [Streptomyces nanshensis]|uniref:Uncharacterized protein n=1 Tax=Streptomyces nanshensis TaxID=518642 RepID=A0A1E7LVD8_9ACTN|nr:hypothetical protein AN221_13235 [Streptomyces nanshensis]
MDDDIVRLVTTVLDAATLGLSSPGAETVEGTEGLDALQPLQLGEQRRRCHAAGEFARGTHHTMLRAPRSSTAITELHHVTVLAQDGAGSLGFATQPVLGLFARMAPTL